MKTALEEIFAVTNRILIELVRMRRSLIFWTVFPALMLLLFGLIYAGGGRTRASFDSTTPGILIGAALFFSCLGGPVALIVTEREHRTLRRLLLSPLKPVSYFLGIVFAHLIIASGQGLVVYGISFVFGGRFHGSILLGLSIFVLSVFSYVGLGFAFGARFARRAEDVNGPVAAFGVPLLVLGGTFFPVSVLPPYLLKLAYLNPIFHMNQALKSVSAQGKGVEEISLHLLFLVVFTAVALLLGIHSYRLMLEKERMGGL
ncbi:MAG: ABC transporter permease [Gemmatimonadetes bacterium]|nr:ABC transporter permease [Gemmatimonadota bacterium]MBT7915189.1 ABC transporter permease [Candidatus Bathyarchaeota archaeon]